MGKFVQKKIKIANLSRNLLPRLIQNGDAHYFCFVSEISFFGKFGPKIRNCFFKKKFGISNY